MVTGVLEAPHQANLSILAALCTEELKRFRRKESTEDRYCLELFRRALAERSDRAWAEMQQCFSETIGCWIRSHPSSDVALLHDSEENYVAQTFSRFWYAMREQHVEFTSLRAVLSYLHATLCGILIDAVRTHLRSRTVPLPESNFPGEPTTEDLIDCESIWKSIQPLLFDERERRAVYLLYYCGLKPREIIVRCPQEFAGVKEIYRLNENVIERLRRNRERLRQLLCNEE